jgi:hypothetical protein
VEEILGTGVPPVHGLLPRNGMMGSVLIKGMVVSFEINKSVGIVHPALRGFVVILKRFGVIHRLNLL